MKNQIIFKTTVLLALIAINVNVYAQCVQCDENSSTTGSSSSVIGMSSSATADGSFAGGFGSEANGQLSFAFGNQVIAGATNSVVFGRFAETTASPSMVFGAGAGLPESERLINNVSNSLMVGFNSNRPTLFVGMSDGLGYTGKIGIGNVTAPHAKLHIKADDGEYVDLLLEPGSSSDFAKIRFGEISLNNSPNRIEAKQTGDLDFYTASDYVFRDGNVGIGLTNPLEKLEVAGTVKSNGIKLTDGNEAAGKILQSDASGLASWVDPMTLTVDDGDWTINGNNVYRLNGNVGIGTTTPSQKLDVNGSIKSTGLNLTDGNQANGRILQSDANGNAHWSDMPPLGDNDWTISGGNVYRLNGNVGIGTLSPGEKLDINGNLHVFDVIKGNVGGTSSKLTLRGSNNPNAAVIELWKGANQGERSLKLATFEDGNIEFRTDGYARMRIKGGNQREIVIGEPYSTNRYVDLKVNGKIWAQEVEVMTGWWPDKVFAEEYKLMPLNEVEKYVKGHKHLPAIPSEADVLENGYNMGEMDAMLLKKIEELTLYVIEQQKVIDELKKKR